MSAFTETGRFNPMRITKTMDSNRPLPAGHQLPLQWIIRVTLAKILHQIDLLHLA
jgi:hypothetical protein